MRKYPRMVSQKKKSLPNKYKTINSVFCTGTKHHPIILECYLRVISPVIILELKYLNSKLDIQYREANCIRVPKLVCGSFPSKKQQEERNKTRRNIEVNLTQFEYWGLLLAVLEKYYHIVDNDHHPICQISVIIFQL